MITRWPPDGIQEEITSCATGRSEASTEAGEGNAGPLVVLARGYALELVMGLETNLTLCFSLSDAGEVSTWVGKNPVLRKEG